LLQQWKTNKYFYFKKEGKRIRWNTQTHAAKKQTKMTRRTHDTSFFFFLLNFRPCATYLLYLRTTSWETLIFFSFGGESSPLAALLYLVFFSTVLAPVLASLVTTSAATSEAEKHRQNHFMLWKASEY
jgi:hypothetical protein